MNQVIKTESPDNSGTNAILIVLLLAAVVAFGVWFFGQGAIPAATTPTNDAGINVDVNLPTTGGIQDGGSTGTQQ
jgi:Na+/H+ antiporter NhaC